MPDTDTRDDVALAGHDGAAAAKLLARAQDEGAAVLGEILHGVVRRKLDGGRLRFTAAERQDLADALAATTASGELLGRARIRKRQEQAQQHAEVSGFTRKPQGFSEEHESFSDQPTDFSAFADTPISPLAPLKALEWFRSLFPSLSVTDAAPWTRQVEKRAFALAVTTEETVLTKVAKVIDDVLAEGKASKATSTVQQILDEAGVSPRNPQYSECVIRSNLMNAYNRGAQEELREVADDFPVWVWRGIRDGRQRPSHEVHFDKYFPSSVTFEEVRDSVRGHYDGFNDRCTLQPVWRKDWSRLKAAGARIAEGWERR